MLPTDDTSLQDTPLRVLRSHSKSDSISSPSKSLENSKRTKRATKKPPLTLFKDPFSPQISEEQRQKLIQLKEADKAKPRKKYSAIKKVKSKRI